MSSLALPGVMFLLGRLIYIVSYIRDPEWRRPGFAIGMVTSLILLVGGLTGVLRPMLAGQA